MKCCIVINFLAPTIWKNILNLMFQFVIACVGELFSKLTLTPAQSHPLPQINVCLCYRGRRIAGHIARGLVYLHSNNIAHMDLKSQVDRHTQLNADSQPTAPS